MNCFMNGSSASIHGQVDICSFLVQELDAVRVTSMSSKQYWWYSLDGSVVDVCVLLDQQFDAFLLIRRKAPLEQITELGSVIRHTVFPWTEAKWRGVKLDSSAAWILAPFSSNKPTQVECPWPAAKCRGVFRRLSIASIWFTRESY